jgi:TetR/AcrR family transcriptional regulator, transcriptional repressor for nem operon
VGTSQAAKAASHDRILDIAAAQIRRDGIDSLAVAELMKEAGLTHGGFYRHFDSREHLVAEAAQRALSQGSA